MTLCFYLKLGLKQKMNLLTSSKIKIEKNSFLKADDKYKNIQLNHNGRTKGGIAWIVNDNIKCKCDHLTHRISMLRINGFTLIGVYMLYNDNTIETLDHYKQDLYIIYNSTIDLKIKPTEVIILGDFNMDPYRKKN